MTNPTTISVKYPFNAVLKIKGKPGKQNLLVRDSIEIDLKDVSASVKPVFSVTYLNGPDKTGDITYYSDGHKLWAIKNQDYTIEEDIANASLKVQQDINFVHMFESFESLSKIYSAPYISDLEVEEELSGGKNTRARSIKQVKKLASEYVVIGERVAKLQKNEPAILLDFNSAKYNGGKGDHKILNVRFMEQGFESSGATSYGPISGNTETLTKRNALYRVDQMDHVNQERSRLMEGNDTKSSFDFKLVEENEHLLKSALKMDYAVHRFNACLDNILSRSRFEKGMLNITPDLLSTLQALKAERNRLSKMADTQDQISGLLISRLFEVYDEIFSMISNPESREIVFPFDDWRKNDASVLDVGIVSCFIGESIKTEAGYTNPRCPDLLGLESAIIQLIKTRPEIFEDIGSLSAESIVTNEIDLDNDRLKVIDEIWEMIRENGLTEDAAVQVDRDIEEDSDFGPQPKL